MFIDTHCHLDFPPFIHDIKKTIAQAHSAGVMAMIIPTVSASHFKLVNDLALAHHAIYAALGLHPIYPHHRDDLIQLEQQLQVRSSKVIAIGEIGLDQFVNDPPIDKQLHFFRSQIILAKTYQLPVILHSRKTHDLLHKELKQAKLPATGVIHGFSGSVEQAMQFVRLGYFIGVGGIITYDRANKTRQAIARLPLESLVLETDSPDMPLAGYQGQVNRPERIVQVFDVLCQLRCEPVDKIAAQIVLNTKTLFNI